MNNNKFCFIACVNDELFFEECKRYIQRLFVPENYELEILAVTDAASMTSGYNEGMKASNAKYKIYLHQDVFITDRYFLFELLDIFETDLNIGMVGITGTREMSEEGVMWYGDRVTCMYSQNVKRIDLCEKYFDLKPANLAVVEAVDGFLMATQYDIEWREDLFHEFDFYDASQSMEFLKRGYRIIVPVVEKPLCVHDDGVILNLEHYDDNRKIFMEEYSEFLKELHCGYRYADMRERTTMGKMTVLMIVDNNAERAEMAINSIRSYNDIDSLELIVVDNASTDLFRDWAKEQTDFTYVYMDEGKLHTGKALNDVIGALGISGDLLILNGNFLVMPNTLSRLQKMLFSREEIGAVGGRSNLFHGVQAYPGNIDYESMLEICQNSEAGSEHYVIGLDAEAVLVRGKTYEALGGFDEKLDGLYYVMQDYMLRMIENNWKIAVCDTAMLWGIGRELREKLQTNENSAWMEHKWGMHYFNTVHNEKLIEHIETAGDRSFNVLEIGCDCGATLAEVKNRFPDADVYGAELNESAARIAAHFAKVTVSNIEECNLGYPDGMFKYIIFGDVLEHLKNPLEVLKYCKKLLTAGGCVLASIPNLMHISVVDDLLKGNFTYTETGLLDKTHIHFFTYNEILRIFEKAEFERVDVSATQINLTEGQNKAVDRIIGLYPETPEFMFRAFQYIVCAVGGNTQ